MKLAILDPGHFHAALLQKTMVADVEPDVHVYAPAGPDLDDYVRAMQTTRFPLPSSAPDEAFSPQSWIVRQGTGRAAAEPGAASSNPS